MALILMRKVLSIALSFLIVLTGMPPFAGAQTIPLVKPELSSGMRVNPVLMRGMKLNSGDGLHLSFIVDSGDTHLGDEGLRQESAKLVAYFLASLTIPEGDVWVNLSPHEKNRITSEALGRTGMGRDLLDQDYLLKRMTASLLDPEGETGKNFWDKVYASQGFDVPADAAQHIIESFNKIWIMPDQAQVFAQGDTVVVIDAKLKVMMEEDYLAREQSVGADGVRSLNKGASLAPLQDDIRSAMRSTIIPIIEDEVNNGETFAPLRQIFYALILAKWFKQNLKESFLARSYADQSKVKGIDTNDPRELDRIYNQYLDVFEKSSAGQFRDDYDPVTQQIVTRKYITGGFVEGKFDIGNQADINPVYPEFYPLGQMARMDVVLKNAAMMNPVSGIQKNFVLILSFACLLFLSSQASAQAPISIVKDSLIVDENKAAQAAADSVDLRLKLLDALMNNYDVYWEHTRNNRKRIFYSRDSWDVFMERQWPYFSKKKLPPRCVWSRRCFFVV